MVGGLFWFKDKYICRMFSGLLTKKKRDGTIVLILRIIINIRRRKMKI